MPRPRYSAAQQLIRWLARFVPLTALSALLLPIAAVRAVRFLARDGRARAALLSNLPADFRPRANPLAILLDRTRVELNWLSWTCRDRFHTPRWTRRIRWRGEHHLTAALADNRPVILAIVHYGPLTFLGRWLCARLRQTGAVADQAAWIDAHARRTPDGRRLAPRVFLPRHTRRLLRFLRAGNAVTVAIDFPRGRLETITLGDRTLTLSTAALRLAESTGALVIPCIPRERWFWRADITFGAPLPFELIADRSLHPAACRLLADTLLAAIRADPHQCGDLLLARFTPAPAPQPEPATT